MTTTSIRFSTVALLLCLFAQPADAAAPAVRVLANAHVHTLNAQRDIEEAVAIDGDGMIVAVGTSSELIARYGNATDLDGATVLPGFHDVHLHAVEAGITSTFCLLSQFGSAKTYARELRDCAAEQPDTNWVIGAGVNMSNLLARVKDPIAVANRASPDRPLLVLDDLGHGAWGNQLALRAAGFDRMVDSPQGGVLVHDETGALNGVVLEASGQMLIDAAQKPDEWFDVAVDSLQYALDEFARHGITSVSDAGGYWPRRHDDVWYQVEAQNALTVRASNALFVYPHRDPDEQIAEIISRFSDDKSARVRFDQVKIYVDGILSQTTALRTSPYAHDLALPIGSDSGFAYFPVEDLKRYAKAFSDAGFSLHFHATGDLGVRRALDAIELTNPNSGPHRLTHLYQIHPDDRPRFRELNVVADFQIALSSVANGYRQWIRKLTGNAAPELMPLRQMAALNTDITLSSDWDADELSPMVKLKTVLTHYPDIELNDALAMMTINAARLLRHDERTGSIEVGKAADLVILDRDITAMRADQLDTVRVIGTLLQGEVLYDPTGHFDN